MNPKFGKRLSALLLSAAVAAGSVVSAGACCGLYIGSDETVTGSTYVGRSEDIGKLYDKVFEVIPAADHAAGAMFEDSYGFSMPYPAHTYRYTVKRYGFYRLQQGGGSSRPAERRQRSVRDFAQLGYPDAGGLRTRRRGKARKNP